MDGKDLRIGNLIGNEGEVFVVQAINTHPDFEWCVIAEGLTIYPAGLELREYGIPLSHEWLERFGFILSEVRKDNAYVHIESGLPIWESEPGCGYYHVNNETLTHLDFVHQLQNFFFVVTGSELDLTPVSKE